MPSARIDTLTRANCSHCGRVLTALSRIIGNQIKARSWRIRRATVPVCAGRGLCCWLRSAGDLLRPVVADRALPADAELAGVVVPAEEVAALEGAGTVVKTA